MCRLLLVENPAAIDPGPYLDRFRSICRNSREYQGHGWGCAWLDDGGHWRFHHRIDPIWEDPRSDFPETRIFLAHARSAFRDEGIIVENNMPFSDGESVFLFNGELRGVRIKAEGRIGAEKIYNFIRRFDQGELGAATRKAVGIIDKRTRYIRAMNFFLASKDTVHICSWFGEDPGYFQMLKARDGETRVVCSEPLPAMPLEWRPMDNRSIVTLPLQTETVAS